MNNYSTIDFSTYVWFYKAHRKLTSTKSPVVIIFSILGLYFWVGPQMSSCSN